MPDQHAIRTVQPASRLRGTVHLPGDKSVSHRYALLAALADGESTLSRFAPGADCASTLRCLEQLGVQVARDGATVRISGRSLRGLCRPEAPLDCGNSGTTLRMLTGIIAAHAFEATLTGDESLRRRPMKRIVPPLEQMGARVTTTDGRPPVTVSGAALRAVDFTPEVPSAQVKSAVLLAGLQAQGTTIVREPSPTRDHTERALRAFGARVEIAPHVIRLDGGQHLAAGEFTVPGDASSAAFWAVAAAGLPGSYIELRDVGLNPSRTAVFDLLRRAGARVDVELGLISSGEPVGSVVVRHGTLRPLQVFPNEVPSLIDELPALAALATFGGGMLVTGASELRNKESDRISALVAALNGLGADAEELSDGFMVRGKPRLRGGTADACGDHRIAMTAAIAALGAEGPSQIVGASCVAVSYPGFFDVLESLRA